VYTNPCASLGLARGGGVLGSARAPLLALALPLALTELPVPLVVSEGPVMAEESSRSMDGLVGRSLRDDVSRGGDRGCCGARMGILPATVAPIHTRWNKVPTWSASAWG
jgi:hypothetical protein